jgi:hypothetical protein
VVVVVVLGVNLLPAFGPPTWAEQRRPPARLQCVKAEGGEASLLDPVS